MSNISFNFADRVVVVTGAGQGIGLELARFFHAAGATTYAVDRDDKALAVPGSEGIRTIRADISDTAAVDALVQAVVDESSTIDILVNNAGILRDGMLWKLTDDDWESVLAVHVGGTFRLTRACVPHFRARGYGRIVNVTSYTGMHGNIGQANYAAAKAGIIGLTKTSAKELARFGITVNAISPNAATQMIESIPQERRAAIAEQVPVGRFADPTEICAAVGFLASEDSAYVTGVVLPVDGGLAM